MSRLNARPPSVLAGTSSFGSAASGHPVYDALWQAGCRGFDTAWIYGYAYGPGCCERVFGSWARSRGVTDECWVLAKGGHTPECRPDAIRAQLVESLDRMDRSRADVYMLHRDDPAVGVGEFVDAMVALLDEGFIGGYGFSNWSLDRVRDAVAWAESRRRPPPVGLSNQFSLAEMIKPIHPGSLSANDPAWRAWLAGTDLCLFPWASQGRGVFALSDPAHLRHGPLAECWFSEANVDRVLRARELAACRSMSPTGIALAWVRAQPFAVCPIIGPRSAAEVADSMASLSCELTPDERDWLETGAPQLARQ